MEVKNEEMRRKETKCVGENKQGGRRKDSIEGASAETATADEGASESEDGKEAPRGEDPGGVSDFSSITF